MPFNQEYSRWLEPTKYKAEYAKQAAVACKLGATDQDLSELFDVSRSTINLWKIQFKGFSDALKPAKEIADSRVERALYQRAVGYSHEEDDIRVIEGKVVVTPTVKHYPLTPLRVYFGLKIECLNNTGQTLKVLRLTTT